MKASYILWHLVRFGGAGAIMVFAGCASTPTRQATTELDVPSPEVQEVNGRVYERAIALQTVAPEHPVELRRAGITGTVVVDCVIDQFGKVVQAKVSRSDGPEFERPALEAVRKWTFKPAREDGVAVISRVSIPIEFGLND